MEDFSLTDEWFQLSLQQIEQIERILGVQFEQPQQQQNTQNRNISPQQVIDGIKALLPHPELFEAIKPVLESDASVEELQNSLFDILGMDGFDLVGVLVQQRQKIVEALQALQQFEDSLDVHAQRMLQTMNRPLYSSDYGQYRKKAVQYPHIYGSSVNQQMDTIKLQGSALSLPPGTKRRNTVEYEEFNLPMLENDHNGAGQQHLVPITDLEPWTRPVFKGYVSLNRMQSLVYPTAYFTNENLLICAPTSAGKTDVAMLTILSTIRHFITSDLRKATNDDGESNVDQAVTIAKDEFKMVYIAPMKALATEISRKFSRRLEPLGIKVKEWTGDTQLSQREVNETQLFIVTPEKWDVITRNTSSIDPTMVRLLLIDEVHLLHDERGAVIETLVARTLRLVESSQSMIRIVGLSATLPNYADVAEFLAVNPMRGMFYFDQSFRPVPLAQNIVGVKGKSNSQESRKRMNDYVFDRVVDVLKERRQAMIFVHSRKDTVKTGQAMVQMAQNGHQLHLFEHTPEERSGIVYTKAVQDLARSRNKELKQLFQKGIGMHHAGMLRQDRLLVERLFSEGLLKVLVCTATLAWGVNLPAYACIIKGTQVYDSEKGAFVDLSILDVLQIFGRAGRPQFEPNGIAYLITTHDKLVHYIQHLSMTYPIESEFTKRLIDNLNAEICATGTLSTVDEAAQWLGYTYWFVRVKRLPELYGFRDWDPRIDPRMILVRKEVVGGALKTLASSQMIQYNLETGEITPRDLGRVAAQYYLKHETMDVFHQQLKQECTEADILSILVHCHEFDGIKVREEEIKELQNLLDSGYAPCEMSSTLDTVQGKINVLLQAYISRAQLDDFTLISDTSYLAQNVPRILRAMLDIVMKRQWSVASQVVLSLCLAVERRMWGFESPLGQFVFPPNQYMPYASLFTGQKKSQLITLDEFRKVDNADFTDFDSLRGLSVEDLAKLVNHPGRGEHLYKVIRYLPYFDFKVECYPLMHDVVRVVVDILPDFEWNDKYSGSMESFWLWIEDMESDELYVFDHVMINKEQYKQKSFQLQYHLPVKYPLSSQVYLRFISDRWIGLENVYPVELSGLQYPEARYTGLLDLKPLPISACQDGLLEAYFDQKCQYFDPIQTQVFHKLYHSDDNLLIGTSGCNDQLTLLELALARFKSQYSGRQAISNCVIICRSSSHAEYLLQVLQSSICGLLELQCSRYIDGRSISGQKAVVVLTADEYLSLRSSIKDPLSLIILDSHTYSLDRIKTIVGKYPVGRLVAFSESLYNTQKLSLACQCSNYGQTFNFRPGVRPIDLQIQVDGFPHNQHLQRQSAMNRPLFKSMINSTGSGQTLVIVPSKKQLVKTMQSLVSQCATSIANPKRFLRIYDEPQLEANLVSIKDQALKFCLPFGIVLYHRQLSAQDKQMVLNLFVDGLVEVLLASVDSMDELHGRIRAQLVVMKGTSVYKMKSQRYEEFAYWQILQAQSFCTQTDNVSSDEPARFHLLTHAKNKALYSKFLNEGYPLEMN
ncbi:hypothetical protein MP228_002644 [Amoeboaphelidium protococcarum]|nr:hypothetical protein MP228_002644 [Amoeboaphelidium protococcarum]